jgi:hypothetical protein
MSTSSLPPDAESLPRVPLKVKPPVLASEILREEVAPIAPARRAIRLVLAGAAGLVPLALGATGDGPLASLAFEGGSRAAACLVGAMLLPGALLFRARYRAFVAARVILAGALALALPALFLLVRSALADAPPLLRAADAALAASILTALFGFMGPETTGACTKWASLIVFVHAARIALHNTLEPRTPPPLDRVLIGALGDLVSLTLVSFAMFQLLAALLSRQAREVDVRATATPPEPDDIRRSRHDD